MAHAIITVLTRAVSWEAFFDLQSLSLAVTPTILRGRVRAGSLACLGAIIAGHTAVRPIRPSCPPTVNYTLQGCYQDDII